MPLRQSDAQDRLWPILAEIAPALQDLSLSFASGGCYAGLVADLPGLTSLTTLRMNFDEHVDLQQYPPENWPSAASVTSNVTLHHLSLDGILHPRNAARDVPLLARFAEQNGFPNIAPYWYWGEERMKLTQEDVHRMTYDGTAESAQSYSAYCHKDDYLWG
jgi:hypothetical protein